VATHGRSIWILDDLTPLHQVHDMLRRRKRAAAADAHLFQPRATVRLRITGGYGGVAAQATAARGPAWPGMVSYARTGASVIRVLPLKQPDGGYETTYLDSGQNPPNGVTIHYHLAAAPAGGVTLTILDTKGRALRTFTSASDGVPARPDLNRFLWNRRLPGVPNVEATDLEPWHRPDGPMVVPGRYAVRLEAGGRSQTQPFDLLPDPRIGVGARALAEQLTFLKAILGQLGTVNRTINEIDARLVQLGSPAKRARAVVTELRAIRGALIDVNYRGAQLWPSGLHEKLNALFDTVDSGDYAPSRQAREVFAVLSGQLDRLIRRWRAAQRGRRPHRNANRR
jgi:hypothetical protein